METLDSLTHPSELELVYNPSLGAYLMAHACRGFFGEQGRGIPVPLAFLILPLTLHEQTRRFGNSTNMTSGLSLFAAKLGTHQEDLLAVHERALVLRELTLTSIAVAAASQLIAIDAESGLFFPLDVKFPKQPEAIAKLAALSTKFGAWFARIPPQQVASILRVSF